MTNHDSASDPGPVLAEVNSWREPEPGTECQPPSPQPGTKLRDLSFNRQSSSSSDVTPSPTKYYRGYFNQAKKQDLLNLQIHSPEDVETRDPLSQVSERETATSEGILDVSLKTREAAQRKDLDHLIGAIAREMVQIKSKTGFMPRYRCSGTKFSGRNIMFKFPDIESLKFYKKSIRNLDGPIESHGGYYVRGSGDPPPFRKYRAWIPGEMMDTVESIPDFLAIETDNQINRNSIKIVGSSPSSSNGYMIYFEVTTMAETYVKAFPSGIMCGAHKLKFSLVNENKTLKSGKSSPVLGMGTRTPSPSSSVDNWRNTPSPTEHDLSGSCHTPRSPIVFYKANRSPFLSTVNEKPGHERRNSAPDVIQISTTSDDI